MSVEVLQKAIWYFGQSNLGSGGLYGQLTKCRLGELVFYVRENVDQHMSFQVGSGERWGDKRGATPAPRRQVLELTPYHEQLAELVHDADGLNRRVLSNKAFTPTWAESILKSKLFNQSV